VIGAATKSADDTRDLAAQISSLVRPGDVVLLSGELGAGKTTFAQGFGRGLGVTEPIVSPTFILMRSYPGRLPLVHCDVYRLDHLQEVIDLGLPELLDDGAVALVEWGDVVASALPADFLEVRMEFGDGEDERTLRFRAVGPKWSARLDPMRAAVSRWSP
jgi:tRNA threonylcarbamoyladenosine biosynthesis protein TsaE